MWLLLDRKKKRRGHVFTPTDVPTLKVWLDFSDAATLFTDAARATPVTQDGEPIRGVADKSGGGRHFNASATAVTSYRVNAQNGKSVCRYASRSGYLKSAAALLPFASKRGAVFVVYRETPQPATTGRLVSTYNASVPAIILYTCYSGQKVKWYDGLTYANSAIYDIADAWVLQDAQRVSDTGLAIHKNGGLESLSISDNQPAANLFYLGGGTEGGQFVGDMAEMLLFDEISEAQRLQVESYLAAKWNIQPANTFVAFGDSVTSGTGASDAAHRWANMVASERGWTLVNSGLTGSVLQNTVQNKLSTLGGALDGNGRDRYASAVSAYYPGHVAILYGLNDFAFNEAAFSDAEFANDLAEIIDGIVAHGTPPGNILIGSLPYYSKAYASISAPFNAGSDAKRLAYNARCAQVALAKGCRFADVYQAMLANGGAALMSADLVHPNDAGHAVIAAAFLAVI